MYSKPDGVVVIALVVAMMIVVFNQIELYECFLFL